MSIQRAFLNISIIALKGKQTQIKHIIWNLSSNSSTKGKTIKHFVQQSPLSTWDKNVSF